MKTIPLTCLAMLSLSLFSCVDRKTEKEEGEIRLEEGMSQDNMQTEPEVAISNEDMGQMAEAKEVINDYYKSFESGDAREAYDMWDPTAQTQSFADYQAKNRAYKQVSVSFPEGAKVTMSGKNGTVTLPVRVSGSTEDGKTMSKSGTVTLKKDASADNPKYKIESMDMSQEDS